MEELGFELKCVAPKANGTLPPGGRNDGDSGECAGGPNDGPGFWTLLPSTPGASCPHQEAAQSPPNVFITCLSSLAPSFSSLLDLSKPDAREGEEQ